MQANDTLSAQIRGRNFYGSIQRKENSLSLEITQFKKGGIYIYEVSDAVLEKDWKRFLIFKKIDDLFNELVSNQGLQVTDQNTLVLPIGVTFKNKLFQLKIEIPLNDRKFSNEAQKMQNLFQQIEKLNQQIVSVPNSIVFRADKTNSRFGTFQLDGNGKRIKMIGTNQFTILNHAEPIKKKGIFYFKIKIIKTIAKQIFLGICGNDIKTVINQTGYLSPHFMGLYLRAGRLYGNNKSPTVASGYTIVDGQSVIKIEIDMNKKFISWFHNDSLLYSTQIFKELVSIDIYPMVNLYSNGDTIEFIDK